MLNAWVHSILLLRQVQHAIHVTEHGDWTFGLGAPVMELDYRVIR
jgi:hypothetical protein